MVQFNGQTGTYLEPSPGEPSFHVLKLAREGLLHGLRTALQTARKTRRTVRKPGLRVRDGGKWHDVNVQVVPLIQQSQSHYLVLFEERRKAGRPAPPGRRGRGAARRPASPGSRKSWRPRASTCSR